MKSTLTLLAALLLAPPATTMAVEPAADLVAVGIVSGTGKASNRNFQFCK